MPHPMPGNDDEFLLALGGVVEDGDAEVVGDDADAFLAFEFAVAAGRVETQQLAGGLIGDFHGLQTGPGIAPGALPEENTAVFHGHHAAGVFLDLHPAHVRRDVLDDALLGEALADLLLEFRRQVAQLHASLRVGAVVEAAGFEQGDLLERWPAFGHCLPERGVIVVVGGRGVLTGLHGSGPDAAVAREIEARQPQHTGVQRVVHVGDVADFLLLPGAADAANFTGFQVPLLDFFHDRGVGRLQAGGQSPCLANLAGDGARQGGHRRSLLRREGPLQDLRPEPDEVAGDGEVARGEFLFLVVLGEQAADAALFAGAVVVVAPARIKAGEVLLKLGQGHDRQLGASGHGLPAFLADELEGRALAFPLVDLVPGDDQRVQRVALAIGVGDDVVLVQHTVEQGVHRELLAGVGAAPAEVLGDARLADEAGGHGYAAAAADFFDLGRDALEVTQPQAEVLFLFLPGLAGELAQFTVDLDGDARDAGLVAVGELGGGDEVAQEAFEDQEAVADEVVVGLFLDPALELGFFEFVRLAQAAAGLAVVLLGARVPALHDFLEGLAEDGAGVGCAAFGEFCGQLLVQQFVARGRRLFPAFARVGGVELAVHGRVKSGGVGALQPAAHLGQGDGLAPAQLAREPFEETFRQGRERAGQPALVDDGPDRVQHQRLLGIGMQQEGVEIVPRPAGQLADGFLEVALVQCATGRRQLGELPALVGRERARVPLARGGAKDVGQLHGPAEAKELGRGFAGELGFLFGAAPGGCGVKARGPILRLQPGELNGTDADDAVVEAGDALAEEQAAVVALGQLDGGAGEGLPGVAVLHRVHVVAKQGADEGVVQHGEPAFEGGEESADFGPDDFVARKGHTQALEVFGLVLAVSLLPARDFAVIPGGIGGDGFGHRLGVQPGLRVFTAHQGAPELDLLGVGNFVLVRRRDFLAAVGPRRGVVTAVVGIPPQDVPELRPGRGRNGAAVAGGGKDRRGTLPGETVATGLAVTGPEFLRRHHAEVGEECLHAGDALAGGAGMAASLAILAAFHREAVIGTEDDGTGAEELGQCGRRRGPTEHGPANGTVADIEGEVEVPRIGACVHTDRRVSPARNQDKVRDADRFPGRQAPTPWKNSVLLILPARVAPGPVFSAPGRTEVGPVWPGRARAEAAVRQTRAAGGRSAAGTAGRCPGGAVARRTPRCRAFPPRPGRTGCAGSGIRGRTRPGSRAGRR